MTRFLVLWHRSPETWPADPNEKSKLIQRIANEFINENIKNGKIKEQGHFLDGNSGYTIWEVESTDLFRNQSMTWPYYEFEVHEVLPYGKSGKILGEEVFKFPTEEAR